MTTFSKPFLGVFLAATSLFAAASHAAYGDTPAQLVSTGGEILHSQSASPLEGEGFLEYRPGSNLETPGSAGIIARTHLRILLPPDGESVKPVSPADARAFESKGSDAATKTVASIINTPSSIACIYELVSQPKNQVAGCNPSVTTVNPAGGSGSIALVDAYNDPTAASDLAFFSKYFELPAANFETVYAGGSSPEIPGPKPPADLDGWGLESSLDIEWAHAMAPDAKIFLVEAQDSSLYSLRQAVQTAEYLVSKNGGGEVSMSWGATETSIEPDLDTLFSPGPGNVTFFSSAGDGGGEVTWPAASPYVVAVGGTTINRNAAGAFVNETAWADGGGGISAFEKRPSFQNSASVESVVGAFRGTPDVSFDANPSSGVSVYSAGKWLIVGGTSLATPAFAGIVNVASRDVFLWSTHVLLNLYDHGPSAAYFRDIVSGTCGPLDAKVGYDLCTGWGSPFSYAGK